MAKRGGLELTIGELADRAGVSVRTVRYYVSQGLLAGPGTRGRAAAYGDEHLARLRLIRRLAEQHVPLGEQRRRLHGLSLADVQGLLGDEERRGRALERVETARSPRDYVAQLLARARAARTEPGAAAKPSSATEPGTPAKLSFATPPPAGMPAAALRPPLAQDWQRWQLAPGIELHARLDAAADHAQLVERLLETARVTLAHGDARSPSPSGSSG